jgi:hypothetical protein
MYKITFIICAQQKYDNVSVDQLNKKLTSEITAGIFLGPLARKDQISAQMR